MAFVRAKTVNGLRYYYLVESNWSEGKVKQVVLEYLGKSDSALQKLKHLGLPKAYLQSVKQRLLADLGKME